MAAPYPTQPTVTEEALWAELCAVAHGGEGSGLLVSDNGRWSMPPTSDPASKRLADLFLPLIQAPPADRPMVIAHLAQTMDGRIAREDGESHWITGEQDLDLSVWYLRVFQQPFDSFHNDGEPRFIIPTE